MSKGKKPITLNQAEINKIKLAATRDAVTRATDLFILAAKDELKLSDDKLIKVLQRADRYAEHLDARFVDMAQIRALRMAKSEIRVEAR